MKKVGRMAGILFLLALIPYVIAQMLILEEMLYIPDYLEALRTGRARVGIALVLKYLSLTAMLGFSILVFPILNKQHTGLAVGYVGLRFLEFGILFSGSIKLMTLVSLSQLEVGVEDTGISVLADTLLREWKWVGFLYMFPFALHNVIFYFLLLTSKLIPRVISAVGLFATILILVNIFFSLLDLPYGGFILFAPIGLVELVVGSWLLIFGFKDASASPIYTENESV